MRIATAMSLWCERRIEGRKRGFAQNDVEAV